MREPDSDFIVPLTDLRRKLRSPRRIEVRSSIPQLTLSDITVDQTSPIEVDVIIEAVSDGVTAVGTVSARWRGPCHLCLDDVFGDVVAQVHEMFSDVPNDEDVYRLGRENIDLTPMVSDALLLEMPLLAKCPYGGAGVCSKAPELAADSTDAVAEESEDPAASSDSGPLADPRWAALDALNFDEGSP